MISFNPVSSNSKTGPIPTSMSQSDTCPDACPLKKAGCYAKLGMVRIHWSRLDKAATEGGSIYSWSNFLNQISRLPRAQLWRHNVAGDLAGDNNKVDATKLHQLVTANKGKRGFGYTHKAVLDNQLGTNKAANKTVAANREAIKQANISGFTINLSANNLAHADKLAALGIAPVVTILPTDQLTNTFTPEGRKVVVCPAVTKDNVNCARCGLCQRGDRSCIVGFPAHGIQKRTVDAIAKAS